MKKEIVALLCFLSLFFVFSSETEAVVTNGQVQFYYESSTSETNTSASSISGSSSSESTSSETSTSTTSSTSSTTSSETTTSTSKRQSGWFFNSSNDHNRKSGSGIGATDQTMLLKTNDQRNIVLVIIGILLVAIALLGWRLVKNRRKLQ